MLGCRGGQLKVALGQDAGRQVLDDLAGRAVVIDGVTRTAGNVRQSQPAIPARVAMMRVRRIVMHTRGSGFEPQACCWEQRDRRQNQRNARAEGDPRPPPTAVGPPVPRCQRGSIARLQRYLRSWSQLAHSSDGSTLALPPHRVAEGTMTPKDGDLPSRGRRQAYACLRTDSRHRFEVVGQDGSCIADWSAKLHASAATRDIQRLVPIYSYFAYVGSRQAVPVAGAERSGVCRAERPSPKASRTSGP